MAEVAKEEDETSIMKWAGLELRILLWFAKD